MVLLDQSHAKDYIRNGSNNHAHSPTIADYAAWLLVTGTTEDAATAVVVPSGSGISPGKTSDMNRRQSHAIRWLGNSVRSSERLPT